MSNKILIIGHKGASSVAPPNSLKAFQKAIDLKADYIEFDVHLSKDNEIVVFHDFDLKTLIGEELLIRDLTVNQLKQFDIGEDERIPTFSELVNLCNNKIGLQCEIKAPGMTRQLYSALKENNLIKSSIISSFMIDELIKLKKLDTQLKVGLLLFEQVKSLRALTRKIVKAANLDFYAVHPHYSTLTKEIISISHNNELMVNTWTVNDKSEMNSLIKNGVDGIITDDISMAKQALAESF